MNQELLKASNKRNAQILITQINDEIEYVERYLSKLKNEINELESIIKDL